MVLILDMLYGLCLVKTQTLWPSGSPVFFLQDMNSHRLPGELLASFNARLKR